MKPRWPLVFLPFFFACHPQPPKTVEKIVYRRPLYDGLKEYFAAHEITPMVILNNDIADNQLDVQLGRHRIKWMSSDAETKIRIDGDEFSLRDKVTLNDIWDQVGSVADANYWDKMKLRVIQGLLWNGVVLVSQRS
jgi:hypothetical protein